MYVTKPSLTVKKKKNEVAQFKCILQDVLLHPIEQRKCNGLD